MNNTETRYAFCETCGNLFSKDRVGITLILECPNCGKDADVISYQEYSKLKEQKQNI